MASSSKSNQAPERFVPQTMHGELVEAEHLLRYWWASGYCEGRRVLDAGCGIGYGAAMLHEAGASEVVAVDISESVIEVARQGVPDSVECAVGDVTALGFDDAAFDVIVCFEVIEHLDKRESALDELARVLRPDGLLLLSSPNRDRYVPGNPHHRHEYVPGELRTALLKRFPQVALMQQHAMLASVVSATDATGDLAEARVQRLVKPAPSDEMYTLAIAGAQLPEPTQPLVTLTHFLELRRWLDHYDRQQQTLTEQTERLGQMDDLRRDRLAALSRLAELETTLADLPGFRIRAAEADEQAHELQSLREQLEQLQFELRRLEAQPSLRSIASSLARWLLSRLRGARGAAGSRR